MCECTSDKTERARFGLTTGRYLICNEQRIVAPQQRLRARQVPRVRHHDACLTLSLTMPPLLLWLPPIRSFQQVLTRRIALVYMP